jgi:L-amino acid N-acyltransferase YncA
MVSVRAAMDQDAGAISHVHVQSWRTTYIGMVPESYLAGLDETKGVLQWREWLTRDVPVLVAEVDGEIVGFVSGGSMREPLQDYDAELFAIYLLKQVQRRGIGTALVKALAKSLNAKGFKRMAAWVLEGNSSSHFYERSGAVRLLSKKIEVGGAMLPVVAYGWLDLEVVASGS